MVLLQDVHGDQQLLTVSRDNTAALWDIKTVLHSRYSIQVLGETQRKATADGSSSSRTYIDEDGNEITETCVETIETVTQITSTRVLGTETIEVWPKIMTYEGHTRWVTCCAAHPGGKTIYTGSTDTQVFEWDKASGEKRFAFPEHKSEVTQLIADGDYLISTSRDGAIHRYCADGREILTRIEGHLTVIRDMALFNNKLFTASGDGSIKCFNLENEEVEFTLLGHDVAVTAIVVDKDFIYTGAADSIGRKWALAPLRD